MEHTKTKRKLMRDEQDLGRNGRLRKKERTTGSSGHMPLRLTPCCVNQTFSPSFGPQRSSREAPVEANLDIRDFMFVHKMIFHMQSLATTERGRSGERGLHLSTTWTLSYNNTQDYCGPPEDYHV